MVTDWLYLSLLARHCSRSITTEAAQQQECLYVNDADILVSILPVSKFFIRLAVSSYVTSYAGIGGGGVFQVQTINTPSLSLTRGIQSES